MVSADHLYVTIARALGHEFTVTIWRAGVTSDVKVSAVQWAEEKPVASAADMPSQKGALPMHFGVDLAPITDETRAQFNLAKDQQGLVVTAVQPDTPGAAAGFSVGDVIERTQVGSYVQGVTPGRVLSQDAMVAMMKQTTSRIDELKKQGWPYVVVLVRGSRGVRFVTMPLADWAE
jgi:serine protease Do